ncbi:MAG: hypothetical protein M3Z92_07060 [Bacteroidota bacterium]|nr:hypothetical protein [Bacteroidota bacterium]
MRRLLFILILQSFLTGNLRCQSFTVDDLVSLATMPSKNIDRFMGRNGFTISGNKWNNDTTGIHFIEKVKGNNKELVPKITIDMYLKDDSRYFCFRTPSLSEYLDGQKRLVKKGFVYDEKQEPGKGTPMLFQKWNLAIRTTSAVKDEVPEYEFLLQEKKIPLSIRYAEDLLKFDSHEFLVSFFGEQNVKKDLFYFSETELKKCSVLFGRSSRQVVFVWNDENNLTDLAYILVSNILPTVNTPKPEGLVSNNEWKLQNGMHPGMSIKDLIELNENDFEIYGNKSELGLMIKPGGNGKIDFKKTAVMMSCANCNNDKIFEKLEVSALDVAKENLPMYVFDIILYPPHR